MKIEEIIHCCHTVKCLHAAGIETMEQLSALSKEELLTIRGIGKVIAAEAQVDQLLTWAEKYDEASYEAKHLIIAALVDRVEVYKDLEVKIIFKVSAEQFLGRIVRIA